MLWIIIWLILILAYVIIAIIRITQPTYDYLNLPITIAGFLGLLSTFLLLLYQKNLTFFFYWTRFVNWFRNYTVKWTLNARYDGKFDVNIISKVNSLLEQYRKEGVSVKVFDKKNNSIKFLIYDNLTIFIDYQHEDYMNLGYSTLDISIATFEIGSNDSKNKLDTQIIPLFNRLQEHLKPDNFSYVLNIKFIKSNPFYSIFLSHLKTSQINNFTIDLHIDKYSTSDNKDHVTVHKKEIVLNTNNLHSLKSLSNDFLYLSTNIKEFIKASQNG